MKRQPIMIIGGIGLLIIVVAILFTQSSFKAATITPDIIVQNLPFEVKVTIEPSTPIIGEPTLIRLEIERSGGTADLLPSGFFLHAAIASNNLADSGFYILTNNLREIKPGTYELSHTFTQADQYSIWIEINDEQQAQHHRNQSAYIGHLAITPIGGPAGHLPEGGVTAPSATPVVADGYTVELTPTAPTANQPTNLTVSATKTDGTPVRLLPGTNHFYYVLSPASGFYLLDHTDQALTGQQHAVASGITLPDTGPYLVWMRLFAASEQDTLRDIIDRSFVINPAP